MRTKVTPFVSGIILNFGYISRFYYNANTLMVLRRISNFYYLSGVGVDLGVSYFVKQRFGLQLKFAGIYYGGSIIQTQFY